jgi:putative hydrolases of HD superfamily
MPETDHRSVAAFAQLAIQLKHVQRQGWLDRGVTDPESVADHSWSVALLAWLLAAQHPQLDRERVLLLGLLHDLPEALAGDATPFDQHRNASGAIDPGHFVDAPGYTPEVRHRKRQREIAALEQMLDCLPEDVAGTVRSAWLEYDAAETAEAHFVKQVDKLETAIQALSYQNVDAGIVIESFLSGAERDIEDPVVAAVLAESRRSR